MTAGATVLVGDALAHLRALPALSVHCVVTSPPYWGLRDYGVDGQLGLERTLDEYVASLVAVFREVRRVLRRDGTCWVNLGDTYEGARKGSTGSTSRLTNPRRHEEVGAPAIRRSSGLKRKDLVGAPWRVALALQADGWWLRSDIVWHKPSPVPESVRDRPTRAHEYVFLLTRRRSYWYDADAIRTTSARAIHPHGVNARSVWTIAAEPYRHDHFAAFPRRLVESCVLAGCPPGGTVLDPFAGSGTTGEVALRLGRRALLIELNPRYVEFIEQRLAAAVSA